jgi:DHA2 family multidrug resistance protein
MAVGLAALQILLDKGQQEDWFSSNLIVWLGIIAVIGLVGFIIWELRVKDPIVDLRVMKNRNFAVGTILIGVVGVVLYGTTALLPLFLQTLLGYPALQSGLAVSPRGFGSIIAMIIVARIVGKIDARYLISFGFILLATSGYMLTNINLNIATSSVVWPNIINGFAMGFIFVPMSTVAMGTLRNDQIGSATGLYNLMRNLGGGVGISVVTTIVSRSTQSHMPPLVAHATPYDPAFVDRLHAIQNGLSSQLGTYAAQQGALASIYGIIERQASLLAFLDAFRLLSLLCLLSIPLVLFFKRVVSRGGGMAAH